LSIFQITCSSAAADEAKAMDRSYFNYLLGLGGFGYEYKDAKILIFFSNDSDARAYNKVVFIETINKKQGILGINPGDYINKAFSILDKSGFRQKEDNYFLSYA